MALGSRYGFSVTPNHVDIVVAREKNEPLKYLQGKFTPQTGESVIVDLLIYRDGIIADTRSSTGDSHAFIDDLLTWGTEELGFLPHGDIVKKKYSISDMHVSSEHALTTLNPKLATFAKNLTAEAAVPGAVFEVGAIGFWPDQNLHYQPVPFRFERVQGAPFSENRYYSLAPLETEVHLSFLKKLEALLTT